MTETSLSGSQRFADKLASGFAKSLKQIAVEIIHRLYKERSPRGRKRESRTSATLRSTRVRSVRSGLGAAYLCLPLSHSRSSLPQISGPKLEIDVFRDALSDNGAPAIFNTRPHMVARETSACKQTAKSSNSASAVSDEESPQQAHASSGGEQGEHSHIDEATAAPFSTDTISSITYNPGPHIRRAVSCAQSGFSEAFSGNSSVVNSHPRKPAAAAAADPTSSPGITPGSGIRPPPHERETTAKTPVAPASSNSKVDDVPTPVESSNSAEFQIVSPLTFNFPENSNLIASGSASAPSPSPPPPSPPSASGSGTDEPPPSRRPDAAQTDAAANCCSSAFPSRSPTSGRAPVSCEEVFTSPSLPSNMRRPQAQWFTDEFAVTRRIHKGYSGSVYKASCLRSGCDVVLKAYNLTGLSTFLRNQVLRELDIHSRLRHPGIVHLMAAFREGDNLVMVQEYVRGGSLERVRRKLGGRMTEFQAMHLVLLPLLGVLGHLHERGVVHRDIKPDNLLFTENWKLKLCDFGISICLRQERAVTRTGTREYLAPEVDRCPQKQHPEDNKDNLELAYTTAVDVWSLGSLMYELIVGFTPFPGGPPPRKPGAKGSAGASLVFPSSASQAAREFVYDCLQLDPADRPTVQQLLQHVWVREALVAAEALISPK